MAEGITRLRAQMLLEDIAMSDAEIMRRVHEILVYAARVDAARMELHEGICNQIPPDIEIQPRVVRSA